MNEWNAMTYEGKETILRVVRDEAERMFALAEPPERLGGARPPARAGRPRRRRPHRRHDRGLLPGLRRGPRRPSAERVRAAGMHERADEQATSVPRRCPQAEMMDRLRDDFDKMMGILEPLGPDDWTGLMVTHAYMGPVPAFFYAAGQLMDYGVHSWDIRAGQRARRTRCPATPPTCWCRSCSRSGRAPSAQDADRAVHDRHPGRPAATPATTGSRSATRA